MQLSSRFLALASSLSLIVAVAASPLQQQLDRRATSVTFDGRTFTNKGLVGFGRISGDAKDSYGESLGGFGSAIALESFTKNSDGTYSASLIVQPDLGHNTQAQTDYRARQHKFSLAFDPTQGSSTTENIQSTYVSTLLYRFNPTTFNGDSNYTTGFDPIAIRPAAGIQPKLPLAPADNHISFDTEGLALIPNSDAAWISDEYGPYIYYLNRTTGQVKYTIQPPQAILPYLNGALNFTSNTEPNSGRNDNQGLEGLTLDRNSNTLWACLQSAVAQDGGGNKATNRYTRMLGYNVTNPANASLVAEYIVPLPQSSKGNTRATSEIHIIDSTTFLILARDGNGFGDTSSDSTFKDVDLISTKGATNIANTKYDNSANPAAPGGTLASGITPAKLTSFVNLIAKTELAKFGLQVGGAIDRTLVASKLESLALAPVGDAANPNDYFLFVVSDNDFITTNGSQAAESSDGTYVNEAYSDPYAQQYGTADSQVFIYRVTLPGYAQSPVPN
ncbi:unnamed protein product [Tilletia controversa]|uniref:Phytase-like domain-containing protein n=3 Tax=Tilletia TaxID=13289 RepID=A0A8X7SYM6_9BASI|nr:hypothetical protein CF336_g3135 [Tilletia laevis]KAE8200652.1 hypothetical protein CF328_g2904 [Tilletia controversa]KAE8260508.1 hypothetical protein A4X03_0g3809 [Tilletia caries]KAE8205645.1 hypothetical protein CF335_g2233 [Tilletia laevis]KAE8251376.1 hypothetical protein A4X06_0g2708 [Tilletia controversa]